MKTRLTIITEIISPYRIPVFNALAQMEAIDLHVVFLAETDPEMRDWLIYKNEINFSFQVLRSSRWRFGGTNLLLSRGLYGAVRKCDPHVILCGGYNYIASWGALLWAMRRGVPFLLWIESHAKELRKGGRITGALKRKFIQNCDGFVVPGIASREYLLSFNVKEETVFTAPDAIDNGLFSRIAADTRKCSTEWRESLKLPPRFFIFVGRLVAEKGVFDLLRAYGAMSADIRTEVGLVFVGDGPAMPELKRQARSIEGIGIRFQGFVQRDMLPRFYALSDALILPTHTDAWGLVVNEGMACSLPIVCTEIAGCVPDLVQDGWNGYVVPAGGIEALTRALERLARNPREAHTMGENSAKRILGYSPAHCADGIANAALWSHRQHE